MRAQLIALALLSGLTIGCEDKEDEPTLGEKCMMIEECLSDCLEQSHPEPPEESCTQPCFDEFPEVDYGSGACNEY